MNDHQNDFKPGAGRGLNIAFLLPPALEGSGGNRNIYRAIRQLKNLGHELTVYCTQTEESGEEIRQRVSRWFYDLSDVPFVRYSGRLDHHEIGFATWWETAWILKDNLSRIRHPFYFVQDYEPYFYALGTNHIMAEASYQFGFTHICSGPWCVDVLKNKHNAEADYFQFPVNQAVYKPQPPRSKENLNLVFFGKPEMPRRCFKTGALALEVFHRLRPEVEIIIYGSDRVNDRPRPFKYTNLGLVPTIEDLAELYRNADLGLAFSSTNPSLVPYEMMASGLAVADLDYDQPLRKYGHSPDNIFLLDPRPEVMGRQLAEIIADPGERRHRARAGREFVMANFPTEEEMGRTVERLILTKLNRGFL